MQQTNFIDQVRSKAKPVPSPSHSSGEMPIREQPGFFQALYSEVGPLLSHGVWLVSLAVTFALPAMLWFDISPSAALIGSAVFTLGGMAIRPSK